MENTCRQYQKTHQVIQFICTNHNCHIYLSKTIVILIISIVVKIISCVLILSGFKCLTKKMYFCRIIISADTLLGYYNYYTKLTPWRKKPRLNTCVHRPSRQTISKGELIVQNTNIRILSPQSLSLLRHLNRYLNVYLLTLCSIRNRGCLKSRSLLVTLWCHGVALYQPPLGHHEFH